MKRPFKATRGTPDEEELAKAIACDPDLLLPRAQSKLEVTGNPYYAWFAIDICVRTNKPFPDWLTAYLGQCAHRMASNKAKAAGDLRKILPWVLGFSSKRGPGNPLNYVDRIHHKRAFALEFATQIEAGDEPAAARLNACNAIFAGKYANVDDRTLQRWLLEVFGLRKAPSTAEEWRKIIHKYIQPLGRAIDDFEQRTKSRDNLS
ncbi:hypothetical protein [Bradyrhizobium sp. JYMT SZCCT0428]|uniref:hypothetical protein n=1 Tax=Bradyrhizobium sp. JYMT SZCCT0428 TaxID=2807673 RepID=UPI001BAADA22|nr:hypothetical protein [Bradyrhizobium sp. JYMT SZCCT0428]MBR1155251.1 hypothetical protein [Bradyrhizobium sp. JYMT SZCCT0428]